MKKLNSKLLLLVSYFLFLTPILNAQESLNSGGKNKSNNHGELSYSIGQMIINSDFNNTGSISNGVQQAFEITEIQAIKEFKSLIQCEVYPNPTKDMIYIKYDDLTNIKYQLLNNNGATITNTKTLNKNEPINMSDLQPATYYLKVFSDNKLAKTFKIIKQ